MRRIAELNRWLLNTFTSLELGLIVVGGATLFAVGGFLALRNVFPPEVRIENNEVAGVLLGLLGAFYGIVLGFVIVVLLEDFRAADDSVKAETTALAQLYRSTGLFEPADRAAVGKAIARYSLSVRQDEWPHLRQAAESKRSHALFGDMFTAVERARITTAKQEAFFGSATTALADLIDARRKRLSAANQTLPTVFQILLLGGAAVLIVFLWFFGMRNVRTHALMLAGVAATLAFSLLLVLMLSYPFSGEIAVSSEPFHIGVIGNLSPKTGLRTGDPCFRCKSP